jgi:hypothetical protein
LHPSGPILVYDELRLHPAAASKFARVVCDDWWNVGLVTTENKVVGRESFWFAGVHMDVGEWNAVQQRHDFAEHSLKYFIGD